MENADKQTEKWYAHQLTAEEFRVFVEESRIGKINTNAWIGNVEPETANKIKEIVGVTISKIMLEGSAVRYSLNKAHHNLETDDILHAVEVINNAASIELSPRKHRDSDVLIFKGNINGDIYFLEAVRPKHSGWLSLVTCYRPEKAGQGSNAAKTAPRS